VTFADALLPNNAIQPAVWVVTPRAAARAAPSHPTADRVRWTVSDHDFPDSRFGRIFSGTE
jgi:hypothetical protein